MRRLFVVLALQLGCAEPAPKPDDMSAAAHRAEADRERAAARAQLAEYRPGAVELAPLLSTQPDRQPWYLYPQATYNPTAHHVDAASSRFAHARAHEAAAAELERFEEEECRGFPPTTRAACPLLLHVEDLVDVPGGVRLRFASEVNVGAVVAHMRCHLAYARTRGFEVPTCPLYVKGTRVERVLDSRVVDVLGSDRAAADEIRHRAREEAKP
jgi:hypothetical protein